MSRRKADAPPPPLRIRRLINAPREQVFAAWIDPTLLAKWFGPPEVSVRRAEVDARAGGAYRIVMHGDAGTVYENAGIYREVAFPARLIFTWSIARSGEETAPSESLVTVEFRATDSSTTEIKMTHEWLTPGEFRGGVELGWTTSFAALDTLCTEGHRSPAP